MKTLLLAVAATALALPASHALAAKINGRAAASPKQPIPYAELGAYMKASPKMRRTKDWWSGQAASADTGSPANTSAIVASPSLPSDTSSSNPATVNPLPSREEPKSLAIPSTPPVETPPTTAVNPPASAAPGSPPTATPPR